MADEALQAELAAHLPDIPRWVGPRGLLLARRGEVVLGPEGKRGAGFLVLGRDRSEAFAVHRPVASLLRQLEEGRGLPRRVYAPLEDAAAWRTLLPGWSEQAAVVHVHPSPHTLPRPDRPARFLKLVDTENLGHLEEDLAIEITDALSSGPVAAAFEGELPVAFAYAAHQTESWIDLSLDTLGEFRRRGLATSAASFLIHHFLPQGKRPVWGAMDADEASLAMAKKYGFRAVDRMMVFVAP